MLKIRKDGAVKGGDIHFDYDPVSEKIHYFGFVKVGFGPLVKKFSFDDHYPAPKELMASATKYAGQKIVAGDCIIDVVSVYPEQGWGTAHFKADDFEGIANIDISKEYIDIIMINGKVEFQGLDLKVNATRQ
jgi:hypothetical protein